MGRFSCYVRGCRATASKRLHCITRTSRAGNWHNVQCPGGYSVTGCGQNELRRQWNHLSGFEEMRVHGNGCVCDSGFGSGRNVCYTRCCRLQVARHVNRKPRRALRPGYYKIQTTGVHAGHSAAQPAGWGLSAWGAHGAVRNHASSWVAVHSGNYWPMIWKIEKSKRVKGTYTIKTTKYGPKNGKMKAGWGLAAWQKHGGRRNSASSWVYTHAGNHWLMDWKMVWVKGLKVKGVKRGFKAQF